jgi:predicted metal-dependent hydrolase
MKKEILLNEKKIVYKIRESGRARCLRITVHPDGELAATLPAGMAVERLENFIRQKAGWILRKIDFVKKRKPAIVLPRSSRREYLRLKERARSLAKRKTEELNKAYNFSYGRISIRNQKTVWGSCSRKGNLNFSYRIVHLPEIYLDYIIVHELCHLKEFNHSKDFWKLVSAAVPNFKQLRKEIRNL